MIDPKNSSNFSQGFACLPFCANPCRLYLFPFIDLPERKAKSAIYGKAKLEKQDRFSGACCSRGVLFLRLWERLGT